MFHAQGPTLLELARQALSSTERGYDLLAPKFDYTPYRTPDEVLDPVFRLLQAGEPIARGLDLCCGTGAALRFMREVVTDEVVGLDISQGMLDQAQRTLCDGPHSPRLRLVRGDMLNMNMPASFDLVTCFGALGHVPYGRDHTFLANIRRVLRPGGRFVFISCESPGKASRAYWSARGFNAAMHLRNAVLHPPFVMYYLRFLLPDVLDLLRQEWFEVATHGGLLASPYERYVVVEATRAG